MSLTTGNGEAGSLWDIGRVAEYLGVTVAALYKWRWRGIGPPAREVGRQLRYFPEEVELWLETQKR